MDVAKSKGVENISSEKDLFSPSIVIKKGKTEKELFLKCILKPGLRILFLKNDEVKNDLTELDLFKRLYVYNSFEKDGRLNFKFHMEARNKFEEKFNESEIDWEAPVPKLRFSYTKYNFLIEKLDFDINMDGTVNWLS